MLGSEPTLHCSRAFVITGGHLRPGIGYKTPKSMISPDKSAKKRIVVSENQRITESQNYELVKSIALHRVLEDSSHSSTPNNC